MEMLKPSQSHSVGVIVKPYTGNMAQELQFLTGEKKKKTKPILRPVIINQGSITSISRRKNIQKPTFRALPIR